MQRGVGVVHLGPALALRPALPPGPPEYALPLDVLLRGLLQDLPAQGHLLRRERGGPRGAAVEGRRGRRLLGGLQHRHLRPRRDDERGQRHPQLLHPMAPLHRADPGRRVHRRLPRHVPRVGARGLVPERHIGGARRRRPGDDDRAQGDPGDAELHGPPGGLPHAGEPLRGRPEQDRPGLPRLRAPVRLLQPRGRRPDQADAGLPGGGAAPGPEVLRGGVGLGGHRRDPGDRDAALPGAEPHLDVPGREGRARGGEGVRRRPLRLARALLAALRAQRGHHRAGAPGGLHHPRVVRHVRRGDRLARLVRDEVSVPAPPRHPAVAEAAHVLVVLRLLLHGHGADARRLAAGRRPFHGRGLHLPQAGPLHLGRPYAVHDGLRAAARAGRPGGGHARDLLHDERHRGSPRHHGVARGLPVPAGPLRGLLPAGRALRGAAGGPGHPRAAGLAEVAGRGVRRRLHAGPAARGGQHHAGRPGAQPQRRGPAHGLLPLPERHEGGGVLRADHDGPERVRGARRWARQVHLQPRHGRRRLRHHAGQAVGRGAGDAPRRLPQRPALRARQGAPPRLQQHHELRLPAPGRAGQGHEPRERDGAQLQPAGVPRVHHRGGGPTGAGPRRPLGGDGRGDAHPSHGHEALGGADAQEDAGHAAAARVPLHVEARRGVRRRALRHPGSDGDARRHDDAGPGGLHLRRHNCAVQGLAPHEGQQDPKVRAGALREEARRDGGADSQEEGAARGDREGRRSVPEGNGPAQLRDGDAVEAEQEEGLRQPGDGGGLPGRPLRGGPVAWPERSARQLRARASDFQTTGTGT
mmetsp:Transcript_80631/g.174332  ORF Transcript_80631/g.174332 Transcript_80631/m.174332 type:complete len:809 (+) Transcript_80631:187-2613(+)